ncbi:DUF771 domain-containing protein [Pediococcus acidilactici]|uniref:DUF771 domain-containing protein n=1 Tax=Pediococcus acidilactici TaxID=1254 RepID=UPI001F4DD284|nr:DUF771 domain-containing protein [Pediococcus acidilactici]MCK2074562.1 DUF771 domain-containing protein [Pediococcus acidilactici]
MAQIVEANIKFEIPADKVLVDRIEWETTKKKAEAHEIWKMDDLKNYMLNKSTEWIKDNVLKNPHLYPQLQELRDKGALGGGGKGGTWWMFADEIKEFIDDNKEVIMRGN